MSELSIEPLARVEGEGGITVQIEGKRIREVRFDILEGARLIESLVVGKTPVEDLSIVCRICAICTLSHRYAGIRGLEKILGIQVPSYIEKLRTLMHLGELLESHSLHVFFLALPDYYDASSTVSLIEANREMVTRALALKKFANEIMSTLSGRMIHGENPTIGGFGKIPPETEIARFRSKAETLLPFAEEAVDMVAGWEIPSFFESKTTFMCCDPDESGYGLAGDRIRISSGEVIDASEYRVLTNEFFAPHSTAKHCVYREKPYTVGALARINNLGKRLQDRSGRCFQTHWNERWLSNPLFNNLAQAIEIVWALEQVIDLVDEILEMEPAPEITPAVKAEGEGVGAVEAPRGILYHYYRIEEGLVAEADFVIPTGQNLADCEKYMRLAVESVLERDMDEKAIRSICEKIARAYDPCISCSAHTVRMA